MSAMMKTLRPSANLSIKHRCVLDSGTQTEHSKRLDVAVLHTNLAGTLAALRSAAKLAHGIALPNSTPGSARRPLSPTARRTSCFNVFPGATISERLQNRRGRHDRRHPVCRDPWEALNGPLTPHPRGHGRSPPLVADAKNRLANGCALLDTTSFSPNRNEVPMLDLIYISRRLLLLRRLLAADQGLRKAMTSPNPEKAHRHGLHHRRTRGSPPVLLPDLRASETGEVLRFL